MEYREGGIEIVEKREENRLNCRARKKRAQEKKKVQRLDEREL